MSFEPHLTGRRIMVMMPETTTGPGTMETLVDANANLRFRGEIKMSRTMEMYEAKYALGNHDWLPSVRGKMFATIETAIDLYPNSSLGTTTNLKKIFNSLGCVETVYTGTGVGWKPSVLYDRNSVTIWVQTPAAGLNSGIMSKFKGCMGNGRIIVDRGGAPMRLELKYWGVFMDTVAVTGASFLDITSADAFKAEAVIGTSVTLGGIKQKLDKLTFDMGNDIQPDEDLGDSSGAGILSFIKVGHRPTIEIDPLSVPIADDGFYADWKAVTERAFLAHTTNLHLSAPKAILEEVGDDARQGKAVTSKKCLLTYDSGIDAAWEIYQGAKA